MSKNSLPTNIILALLPLLLITIGCGEGHLVVYSSGPDGEATVTEYSYVYRQMKKTANGQIGIEFLVDQAEGKGYFPGTKELGLLPPSDMESQATVVMNAINLTDAPVKFEVIFCKLHNEELLGETIVKTIPAGGFARVDCNFILIYKYGTEVKDFKVEYKSFGKKYYESFSPNRLSLQQWDEYLSAQNRIKADSAADFFKKTYDGN